MDIGCTLVTRSRSLECVIRSKYAAPLLALSQSVEVEVEIEKLREV